MRHSLLKSLFLALLSFVTGNAGAETKWVKTDPAELAKGDVVVIYDMYRGYAMANDGGTSTPEAVKLTLTNDNNQLKTVPSANLQWTVKRENGYYQFYATETTYLYCNSSDNGLRVGESSYHNFEIKTVDGKQWLYIAARQRYVVLYRSGSTIDWRSYQNTTDSKYKNTQIAFFKKVSDENDVNLTISSVGYATLYYGDRALKVPQGVTATTYSVENGYLAKSKTYEAGKTIPKGEAVVLSGPAGEYKFVAASATEEKDANNKLKGSDNAEMTTGGEYYYALRAKAKNGTGGPGFYWMDSTGREPFENGAHKAYLAIEEKFAESQEVGGAKSFFLFEEATGIGSVQSDDVRMEGQRYNMSGQRVDSSYKGIVIVDGKKFLHK